MCTCNKYVCANASKVGQVLHIECKFEMTIYPQNLRYAVLYAKLRWSRLAEARNCDFPFDKPTVVRYYPDYYFNSDSHTRRRRLASLVIMASPKPIYDLRLGAPSSTRVVEWWKKVNPTDNFVVSRIHYPIPFFCTPRLKGKVRGRLYIVKPGEVTLISFHFHCSQGF